MYGTDDLTASALLESERRSLETAGQLERQLDEIKEHYAAEMAKLIADRTRERREWAGERQRLTRRAEGLATDLGRTNARLSDCRRHREMIESQHRLLKSSAQRMVTAHAEGTDVEADDACHALRKLLTR